MALGRAAGHAASGAAASLTRTESRAQEADPGDAAVGLLVIGVLLDDEGAGLAYTLVAVDDVVPAGDLGGVDAEYVVDVQWPNQVRSA